MAIDLLAIDVAVLMFINKSLANPVFDLVMQFLQNFTYVFCVFLILFFAFKRKKELALLLILAAIISLGTSYVLKTEIHRDRPYQTLDVRQLVDEDAGKSFPSNHVLIITALSTVIFSYYRRFGIALFAFTGLVAFSRIYVGVHYPSDVLAGAIIGLLIGLLILKLFKPRINNLLKKL
ncbi:MAG: phosphatase PAP2 family protein [Candidatus Aenigmarchaeota archaeon]|nr:phosphatase PAP2 family protein [Candidatus Aenigmarchaeota archaeon]